MSRKYRGKAGKGLMNAVTAATLVGLTAGLAGGGLLYAAKTGHLPMLMEKLTLLQPNLSDNRIFAGGGITQEEARELYRASLAALKARRTDEALTGFDKLEKAYPGLQDLILLHKAEAYSEVPNELMAQTNLKQVLRHDGPLKALGHYRMGQSHFKAKESAKAKEQFETVRQAFPKSSYATGSLYYLGYLEREADPKSARAVEYWKQYLTESPDGRFSAYIAEELDAMLTAPTPEEHLLIGKGYAMGQRNPEKAIQHLQQAPVHLAWLELGKAQLRAGQAATGLQTLANGLPLAKKQQESQEAVDIILRNSPNATKLLAAANPTTLRIGGDYILWQLAQADSTQAQARYQAIVSNFPQSDYAPESSWNLAWPLLKAGNHAAFLQQAAQHLERYPYSRSAAKMLFWQGKVFEKTGKKQDATAIYRKVQSQYPHTYYAYRAIGRLKALESGQADPGWRTAAATAYPPSNVSRPSAIPNYNPAWGERLIAQAKELEAIGAWEDAALLTREQLGETPPEVQSALEASLGASAKSIRTIRDALDKQFRATGKPPQPDQLKMLYPVYFSSDIARRARENRLDPFLIQALMREESYFNELAKSSSNALGLMQLLPPTAQEVAGWVKLPSFDPLQLFIPEVNIQLGSRYLAHLHGLYNSNAMLAVGSYNGGPNAMRRWVGQSSLLQQDPDLFVESIPYEQTRDYIKKVFNSYWNYHALYGS